MILTTSSRARIRCARFFQGVALIAVLAGINLFCAYCLPAQIDLTHRGTFTLAPQTVKLLAALRSPVEVTVLSPKTPRSAGEHNFRNAAVLFHELLETCRRIQPLVRFQELDLQESASARRLQQQFPDVAPPCVLITFGPTGQPAHEVLSARDLAEFRAAPDRRLAAVDFLGEQALAGALARLGTGTKQATLYVATGHGELALDDNDPTSRRGMGMMAAQLRDLGCELRSLDLTAIPRVPFDATLVVVPGGEQTWSPAEAERLGKYLRHGGKALVLVDLNFDSRRRQPVSTGLEELLSEFGVSVGNDRIITQGFTGQVEVASPALPAAGEHPLVRALPQSPLTLVECRSLRSSTGLRQLATKVIPLLVSHPAPRAWAEGDFETVEPPQPGGPDDSDGPVAMAVAIERRQDGEPASTGHRR
jgi:ABC-type uncharacterized transport system involved in gliding motility auxiliary subunit